MQQPLTNNGQISPTQQLHVLKELFQKIKDETHLTAQDSEFFRKIEEELKKSDLFFFEQEDLQKLITTIKQIIAAIENNNQQSTLLKHFKEYGIYRIFYHNPVVRGKEDTSNLKRSLKNGVVGIGIAALITVLFATSTVLGAPAWITVITTALFASAVTYLSALVYGVFNNVFATKANLPYFLVGHQPHQHSLLRTNDPVAQSLAWGIAATHRPALLASITAGVTIATVAVFVPIASFIIPSIFIAMPLIAWGADIYAKRKAKHYIAEEHPYYGKVEYATLGRNAYQRRVLAVMAPNKEEKASWLANIDRNMFGFTKLPIIGLGVLALTITLSAVHSVLPALLFSSLLATIMPVTFAAAAILSLAATTVYTYLYNDTQIPNRYKLSYDFTKSDLKPELYWDEDLPLVEQLSIGFQATTKSPDITAKSPSMAFKSPSVANRPIGATFKSPSMVSKSHRVTFKSPNIVVNQPHHFHHPIYGPRRASPRKTLLKEEEISSFKLT